MRKISAEKPKPKHSLAVELHGILEAGRKKNGITQLRQFVALIGISENTYRNWRNGLHHPEHSFAIEALKLVGQSEQEAIDILKALHRKHSVEYIEHDGRRFVGKRIGRSAIFEPYPRALHASFGPTALLDARFGIAPFIADAAIEAELDLWVCQPDPFLLRMEYGPGGVGKTRRWLEYCSARRDLGVYGVISRRIRGGFWEHDFFSYASGDKTRVIVVDYAESQLEFVASLIHATASFETGKTRIILLARNAADWWLKLKRYDAIVQEVLHDATVSEVRAAPMAIPQERQYEAIKAAMASYADRLGLPTPSTTPDHSSCKSAIDLQLSALATVTKTDGTDLVAAVLERERRFWDKVATSRISSTLIEALVAAVYQMDGIDTAAQAKDIFLGKGAFQDLSSHDLRALFEFCRTLYPGDQYLNPIQPDLIGERLLEDLDAW